MDKIVHGSSSCFFLNFNDKLDIDKLISFARAFNVLFLVVQGKSYEAIKLLKDLGVVGSKKVKQEVKIDYFATSLPLPMVFDEDLDKRNEWDSKYLITLAEQGLGNQTKARGLCCEIPQLNSMHTGTKGFISNI